MNFKVAQNQLYFERGGAGGANMILIVLCSSQIMRKGKTVPVLLAKDKIYMHGEGVYHHINFII